MPNDCRTLHCLFVLFACCISLRLSCCGLSSLLLLVQVGVAMASAAEVSFNWTGFISAMVSNLTFSFRAVLGKKCEHDRVPN